MILLQATMAGGMYLALLIGIAILIGTPILTILISNSLSRQDEKLNANRKALFSSSEYQKPKTSNNFFTGCIISIAIMIVVISLGIWLLGMVVPDMD